MQLIQCRGHITRGGGRDVGYTCTFFVTYNDLNNKIKQTKQLQNLNNDIIENKRLNFIYPAKKGRAYAPSPPHPFPKAPSIWELIQF